MTKSQSIIFLLALSIAGCAAAQAADTAPTCIKMPGEIGGPMVTNAATARTIYLAIARQRNDPVLPENKLIIHDGGDSWHIFQYRAPYTNKEGALVVIQGGGTLELLINKCTGALRAWYTK